MVAKIDYRVSAERINELVGDLLAGMETGKAAPVWNKGNVSNVGNRLQQQLVKRCEQSINSFTESGGPDTQVLQTKDGPLVYLPAATVLAMAKATYAGTKFAAMLPEAVEGPATVLAVAHMDTVLSAAPQFSVGKVKAAGGWWNQSDRQGKGASGSYKGNGQPAEAGKGKQGGKGSKRGNKRGGKQDANAASLADCLARLDKLAEQASQGPRHAQLPGEPEIYVRTPNLDDRLGIWVILDVLPLLGVVCDVILSDSEECGNSTAAYFGGWSKKLFPAGGVLLWEETAEGLDLADDTAEAEHWLQDRLPAGKSEVANGQGVGPYNWVFSFDRRGTDVVMYQYDCKRDNRRLNRHGFNVGRGSFSDIAFLDHLEVSGFNVGVAYHGEHTRGCEANLGTTLRQAIKFSGFYAEYQHTHMPYRGPDYDLDYGRADRGSSSSYGNGVGKGWPENRDGYGLASQGWDYAAAKGRSGVLADDEGDLWGNGRDSDQYDRDWLDDLQAARLDEQDRQLGAEIDTELLEDDILAASVDDAEGYRPEAEGVWQDDIFYANGQEYVYDYDRKKWVRANPR